MLITREYYFEDRRDEFTGEKIDNSYLFEGLNIKAEGEKYTKYIGKYPVINLFLKSAKQGSLDLAFQCIREEISNEFKRHKYIIESDVLKAEKEHFMKIVNNAFFEGFYKEMISFIRSLFESALKTNPSLDL